MSVKIDKAGDDPAAVELDDLCILALELIAYALIADGNKDSLAHSCAACDRVFGIKGTDVAAAEYSVGVLFSFEQ